MSQHEEEIALLTEEFAASRKVLCALGDENRQHMILEMLRIGKCGGVRVGEITARTNLSRPAVSHHIKVLKEAGLVKMRREGTKNYYYFDPDAVAMQRLVNVLMLANEITSELPDRSGEI